jgi:hypothetical protein
VKYYNQAADLEALLDKAKLGEVDISNPYFVEWLKHYKGNKTPVLIVYAIPFVMHVGFSLMTYWKDKYYNC